MSGDIAAIAAGLSSAQRAYLMKYAKFRSPAPGHEKRWMTFPPRNTHAVLMRLGLVDGVGQLRESGLAVRAYLEGKRHD